MTIRTRPADSGDAAWIVTQHGKVYAEEFGFDARFRDSIERKMSAWRARNNAFDRLWIGECNGERAGSIAISERPERSAFLNFVLVLPAYRGNGAGRALMEAALTHARVHGMREARLETYNCLTDARRLYRRLGFTLTETTPDMQDFGQRFDGEFWTLALAGA